ncbi:hypothetical protein KUTeg_014872 [Tegillarca granosa]|uniref:Uncharacterized protein n=1 Tax=Tegillarca granosa TaxID=220873 RepID=A0ABQ9EUE6_TEGGR|nr:hypothetical protein KUTeg_014872 [Tegillarca granosa]
MPFVQSLNFCTGTSIYFPHKIRHSIHRLLKMTQKGQQNMKKTISWKNQSVSCLRKSFIRPGEFPYVLPKQNLQSVCYSRQKRSSSKLFFNCFSDFLMTILLANVMFESIVKYNEPFLKDVELYYHLLKSEKAVSLFGNNVVIIKDIGKYVLLERKPVKFTNSEYNWIFWCSCNNNRSREVASLDSNLMNTYDDCIHMSVARLILGFYDHANEINPYEIEDIVYEVESNIFCCNPYDYNRFGLILCTCILKLYCTTCNSNRCCHVGALKRLSEEGFENPYYSIITRGKEHEHNLISFIKVPFERSDNLTHKLHEISMFGQCLMPDQLSCKECGSCLQDGDPIEKNWVAYDNATVITNTRYLAVPVAHFQYLKVSHSVS